MTLGQKRLGSRLLESAERSGRGDTVGAKLTAQTANVRATTCFYPRHGYAGGVPSINDGVDEIEFEKLW